MKPRSITKLTHLACKFSGFASMWAGFRNTGLPCAKFFMSWADNNQNKVKKNATSMPNGNSWFGARLKNAKKITGAAKQAKTKNVEATLLPLVD